MNILFEYIKYRWNAKKRHGIHSPYVYALSDGCASITFPIESQKIRNEWYKSIRNSGLKIHVTDLGAGSKKMSERRSLKSLLRYSSTKGNWGEVLFKLCKYSQPSVMLELGTSLGLGTWHIHQACPQSHLTTVEGCPETYRAMRYFTGPLLNEKVSLVLSSFETFLKTYELPMFDLIFIDGHHDGEALIYYIQQLMPFTHDRTLFILDDIRWSQSMFEAWNSLRMNETFHVTIDLFRMGILVKKVDQEKEHFVLRM